MTPEYIDLRRALIMLGELWTTEDIIESIKKGKLTAYAYIPLNLPANATITKTLLDENRCFVQLIMPFFGDDSEDGCLRCEYKLIDNAGEVVQRKPEDNKYTYYEAKDYIDGEWKDVKIRKWKGRDCDVFFNYEDIRLKPNTVHLTKVFFPSCRKAQQEDILWPEQLLNCRVAAESPTT